MRPALLPHIAAVTALMFLTSLAAAHEPTITRASVVFAADGSYRIEVACDFDALLLGLKPGRLSEEDYARLRALPPADIAEKVAGLREGFLAFAGPRFDGAPPDPATVTVEFPEYSGDAPGAGAGRSLMGRLAVVRGPAPAGARVFSLFASPAFDWINLTVAREGSEAQTTDAFKGGRPAGEYPVTTALAPSSPGHIVAQYLVLGYEHIVPKGIDHILFVLGLCLLSPKLKPLLWQLTAFTVAHSVTLALSMSGVFSLPPQIVEPAIAASIAYIAVENIVRRDLRPSRTAVVFLFGLVHGMGFARVLSGLGLPRGAFVPALLSFNVGVEAGQLSVVLGALLVTGWCRNRSWYRVRAAIPASGAIAAVGLYWAVQRAVAG